MHARSAIGLTLLVVGALMLADVAGWLDFTGFMGTYWPGLLILAGAFMAIGAGRLRFLHILLILIGLMLLLENLGFLPTGWPRYVWPVLLIAAGLAFLTTRRGERTARDSTSAWFGSKHENVVGSLTTRHAAAVFGTTRLDVSRADVSDGATIDATSFFGTLEIVAPASVQVKVSGTPFLGSIDNKAQASTGHVMHIKATVLFGSLQIEQASGAAAEAS